ncbi:MAG: isoaspartyl peptidase/L-asparaginase [Acidimicrobiales bacterium]
MATPQDHRVAGESGRLRLPAICIHGGAGSFERVVKAPSGQSEKLEAEIVTALGKALDSAWTVLESHGPALDAVVEAVASLEASGRFNAGRGAVATTTGEVELDAGVMDGVTGAVGAVCASRYPDSAVRAARAVAGLGGPGSGAILLAGAGADDFAREQGLAPRITPAAAPHEGGAQESPGDPDGTLGSPGDRHGTVGAVAADAAGHIAAATSTGGIAGQRLGRVGDSPIPGAGVWAGGGTVAVSATGTGESFLVTGFAHRVDFAVSAGQGLREAVDGALGLVAALGGQGGAVAICPDGSFAARFSSAAMARGWRDPAMRAASLRAESR